MKLSKIKSCSAFVKDYAYYERMKLISDYPYPDWTLFKYSVIATACFVLLIFLGN
jgi:hypothetical protein